MIPLLVLLVTPANIKLLEDRHGESAQDALIPALLRQIFEFLNPKQQFHVLAAVVDKIPYSRYHGNDKQLYHTSTSEFEGYEGTRDGVEGIAVAALESESAAADLWSTREELKEQDTMTIQQRCTISFSFPPVPAPFRTRADYSRSQPLGSRTLQLPVANTLFQNGRTSTMFAQRWVVQKDYQIAPEAARTWLSYQTIHMGNLFPSQDMSLGQFFHSYLTQITPTRVVAAAIGNIVRRINAKNAEVETVFASEELERAISKGIASAKFPAQQAEVWALVRDRKYTFLDSMNEVQDHVINNVLQRGIFSGCRLHKVLSGGGGWGEKRGLLALDPDSDYGVIQQAWDQPSEDGSGIDAEKDQGLGDVVKPGDTITFYIYKSPSSSEPAVESSHSQVITHNSSLPLMMFGSLPSTLDNIPSTYTNTKATTKQPDHVLMTNYFGMLSEQGMSLKVSITRDCVHSKV